MLLLKEILAILLKAILAIALGFWEVKVKAWFKDSELEAAM